MRDMARFERTSAAKKRREENCSKLLAAESLLQLSVVGNGTTYCEPRTGTCSMTNLTMKDLEQAEAAQIVVEQLKNENEKLFSECSALIDECQSLKLECEELKKITPEKYTEAYFQNDNAKVKYYTGLPSFETLMAIFNFVSALISLKTFACVLTRRLDKIVIHIWILDTWPVLPLNTGASSTFL